MPKIAIKSRFETRWRLVNGANYPSEAFLRDLLYDDPSLVPFEDIMGEESPPNIALKEVGLPGAGSSDLILVDASGTVTIIECKLASNPEAKRAVIGQTLDYAAALWGVTYEEVDRIVKAQHGKPLIQVMEEKEFASQDVWDPEDFRLNVANSLADGSFRLMIAVDFLNDDLRRILRYVSVRSNRALEIYALQIQYHNDGEVEALVPRIITYARGGGAWRGPRGAGPVPPEVYFETLSQSVDPEYVDLARRIIEDAGNRGYVIDWKHSSYVAKLRDPGGSGRNLTLFVVTTAGDVYPGWLGDQLASLGLSKEIGYEFVEKTAQLFDQCEVHPQRRNDWTRAVGLAELHPRYEQFMALVQEAIDRIRDASKV